MASGDEGIARKRFKKDSSSNAKVYQTDEVFLKVDNLEYFPELVLLRIFKFVDDGDLCSLAEISNRFGPLAQLAFNEKYSSKYFTICKDNYDDEDDDLEMNVNKIADRFGNGITAVYVEGFYLTRDHWITGIITKHSDHIRKFHFCGCEELSLNEILSQNLNATHLTIEHCESSDIPPSQPYLAQFHELQHFEINYSPLFGESDFIQLIQNAPNLETLIIDYLFVADYEFYDFDIGITEILENANEMLDHIKKLHVLDVYVANDVILQRNMNRLESLKLAITKDSENMMRSFESKCPNLTELILVLNDGKVLNNQIISAICSFTSVSTFGVHLPEIPQSSFKQLIRRMPNVTKIFIHSTHNPFKSLPPTYDYLLDVLRENQDLQKIVLEDKIRDIPTKICMELLQIMQYRQKSVEIEFKCYKSKASLKATIAKNETTLNQKNNVKIELKKDGKVIATYSEINDNQSGPGDHILEFAKVPTKLGNTKGSTLFDFILDHLPMNDLYSLYHTSVECRRLVHNYVKELYQEGDNIFFLTKSNISNDAFRVFAPYISNIRLHIHLNDRSLWKLIVDNCKHSVKKMKIHEYTNHSDMMSTFDQNNKKEYEHNAIINCHPFDFPNLMYFEYSSNSPRIRFNISKLYQCSKLKRLKMKTNVWLTNNYFVHQRFPILETVKFFTRNDSISSFIRCLNYNVQQTASFLVQNLPK